MIIKFKMYVLFQRLYWYFINSIRQYHWLGDDLENVKISHAEGTR